MIDLSSRRPNARRIARACLALGLIAFADEGSAAGREAKKNTATVPAGPVAGKPEASFSGERPISWMTSEAAARGCSRNRRKIWQDGEGWVVKAVRSCP